jgi:hypothetical protein
MALAAETDPPPGCKSPRPSWRPDFKQQAWNFFVFYCLCQAEKLVRGLLFLLFSVWMHSTTQNYKGGFLPVSTSWKINYWSKTSYPVRSSTDNDFMSSFQRSETSTVLNTDLLWIQCETRCSTQQSPNSNPYGATKLHCYFAHNLILYG